MTPWRWLNSLSVLVLVLELAGGPVWAQDSPPKECDPQDPKKCSQPLRKGDTAPFSGQLVTPELGISLGQKAFWCDEKLRLELDFQARRLKVDLDLEKTLRKQDSDAYALKEKLLMERLKEAHSRPFYESPAFVATVSVVATVLVFLGASYAIKKVD